MVRTTKKRRGLRELGSKGGKITQGQKALQPQGYHNICPPPVPMV
jgi:hypothetical protein